MRKCLTCHLEKPEKCFPKNGNSRVLSHCKPCYNRKERNRYELRKDKVSAQKKKAHSNRYKEAKVFVWEYLRSAGCQDCGEKDPIVLEFDHRKRSEKKFNIANGIGRYSMTNLKEEISKCDVLCANCHRRRTHVQMGWKTY